MNIATVSAVINADAIARRIRELEEQASAPVITESCYEIRKQDPPTVLHVERPQYRFDGRMKARNI